MNYLNFFWLSKTVFIYVYYVGMPLAKVNGHEK